MGAWLTIDPMNGPSYAFVSATAGGALAMGAVATAGSRATLPTSGEGGDVGVAPGGGSCLQPADQPKKAAPAAATTMKPAAQAAKPPGSAS
jgi:hypothetical protein